MNEPYKNESLTLWASKNYLWAETRIPLFQQSIDTRGKGYHLRERAQRVTFGNRWVDDVTDVYKNDIARHTLLFMIDIKKDSLETLDKGKIPKLEALQLHNGTIYKWNRPCYGVSDGVPHLRIENRYIPSGPTVLDEIANLAFWVGLMHSMPENYRDNWQELSFDEAKENFKKAAMWGIQSGMVWDGKYMSARTLLLDKLIPMSREGLEKKGINATDIDKYLSIIEARASGYLTGSRWIVKSHRNLRKNFSREVSPVWLELSATLRNSSIHNILGYLPGVYVNDERSYIVDLRVARFFGKGYFSLIRLSCLAN